MSKLRGNSVGLRFLVISQEKSELFFQKSEKASSFAVVPIRDNQSEIALFTLGHEDPEFFSERKETFFLEFLADMFSILIPKNLKA